MTQEDPRRRHDPNRSSPAANAAHVARSARAKVTPSPQYRTERAAAVAKDAAFSAGEGVSRAAEKSRRAVQSAARLVRIALYFCALAILLLVLVPIVIASTGLFDIGASYFGLAFVVCCLGAAGLGMARSSK
jgi:hypothetical protein